jgi:hypothetical protein
VQIAVFGAGALGRVFGVRLARRAGVAVDFVVRPSSGASGAIAITRVNADGDRPETLDAPSCVTVIPGHADAVLVCVRAEQLGRECLELLARGPEVPLVFFTPMLPATCARVKSALGPRVYPAMSNVLGRRDRAGVVRYWVSRTARTLIEEPRGKRLEEAGALRELLEALGKAEIDARFQMGVEETGAATALSFLPLAMGIDAAGSADALAGNARLLKLTLHAQDEARTLARRVGEAAPWVATLGRFLGPLRIKVGLALAHKRSPEAIAFVEEHFGRSARAQNRALGGEAVALADAKGVRHESLSALLGKLEDERPHVLPC